MHNEAADHDMIVLACLDTVMSMIHAIYSLQDIKWQSLNEQRNDPSAFMDLDLGNADTSVGANESQEPTVRNIPPYDPAADTSERAYLFDEIIPKSIRPHLVDIIGHFESGEISSKGYGSFVSNRVNKLQELQVNTDGFLFIWFS